MSYLSENEAENLQNGSVHLAQFLTLKWNISKTIYSNYYGIFSPVAKKELLNIMTSCSSFLFRFMPIEILIAKCKELKETDNSVETIEEIITGKFVSLHLKWVVSFSINWSHERTCYWAQN